MTLFTLLLVLGWERLFKLGEHWQLEHRLEPIFRQRHHFSMMRTLLMTVLAMALTALVIWSLKGLLFGVLQLLFWIVAGLLCIGAGSVRQHYHSYLKAASHDDDAAHQAMAAELTLIHGVPVECSEREFLRELQNALIWINFRFYLAPMFWLVVGGPWGPVLLVGYAFLRARKAGWQSTEHRWRVHNLAWMPFCIFSTGSRCGWRVWLTPCWVMAKSAARTVCFADRSASFSVSGADDHGAVLTVTRSAHR